MDYNRNWAEVSPEETERDEYLVSSLLGGMQSNVIPVEEHLNQFTECLMGGVWGGYFADSQVWANSFSYFNPSQDWLGKMYLEIIPNVYSNWLSLQAATKDETILAVGQIVKAAAFQRVTDTYGPIPYSRIGSDGKVTAPLDTQREVYEKIFEELDAAVATLTEHRTSSISAAADKVYSGDIEKWIKFEAGANEVPEAKMIEAIYAAHELNQKVIAFIDKIVAECGKPKHSYTSCAVPEELFEAIKELVPPAAMEEAVFTDEKQVREENIRQIKEKLEEAFADKEDWLAVLDEAVYQYQKKTVRKMILKDHKRPDGRQITQIRPLAAEVDIIPRVHGSAMFTRGQTQICNVVTLAPLSEAQKLDGLDTNVTTKRYMHHYNFPSYSVGETKPSRGPGRREIGHGALAERALVPVLPSEDEFPYAIRSVSETFESNGSTSMASTCASCMSLMAAGVPIKKMVAGISCGLVTGETDDDYVLLTDIQGLEDFFGDMDFKVTGTTEGITAIQMDIKIHGLTRPIVEGAIARCREARLFIMDTCMKPAIAAPRDHVGELAPKIIQTKVDPEKIGEIIGQRGKTINAIIEETGVKIDIDDDGNVFICGVEQAGMDKALKIIRSIVDPIEVGKTYEGKVVRIMNFGAFVELSPNKDGLIHISKLADHRVEKVEDVVNIGDVVKVKVLEVDRMGKISLSLKDAE